MSRDLTDVLHAFVDDRARASAAEGPDPAQRARTVAALVRRRRSRRVGGLAAASVALLAAGAVAASALTGPEPQPAVPEPSATTSASPSGTPTSAPTPTPTPEASALAATEAGALRGVIAPIPDAPRALWTTPLGSLAPAPDGERLFVSHVTTGFYAPHHDVVDAGTAWVYAVGAFPERHIVGVDPVTGAPLWRLPSEPGARATTACFGVDAVGSIVCTGTDAAGGHEIQLREPTSGELVRSIALEGDVHSTGYANGVVIAHGRVGVSGIFWQGIDVSDGSAVWSHEADGAGDPAEPGTPPGGATNVVGDAALLMGHRYSVYIDVRTGESLASDGKDGPTFESMTHGTYRASVLTGRAADELSFVPTDLQDGYGGEGEPSVPSTVRLEARSAAKGSTLWTYEARGADVVGVLDDTVLLRDWEGLVLVDARTGARRWSTGHGLLLAFDGSRLIVQRFNEGGGEATLDALSVSDGTTSWSVPAPNDTLAVVGDTLSRVAYNDQTLSAIGR